MQCIIFTDSKRLAEKYNVSRQDVIDIIQKNLLTQNEIEFLLLDANEYKKELGKSPSWHEYKSILLDFMMGMGLQTSPSLSLFIIGGDDVIPMPRTENPLGDDKLLQADFLYCFKEDELDYLNANDAQCNVGRLPMENGKMPTSLKDDLQCYFNLAGMFMESGIDVDKVVMTSTQSWLPASNEMVRGLPVEEPRPIPDATKDNMYTSPRLAIDDNTVVKQYKKDLGKADMLMFNLHGTDTPGYSSFYGEGATGHNNPEAFDIEMLRNCNARIFNTVACFGGRYIGYNRTDSMLLSALYGNGIMLYAGACVSALGRSGQQHVAAHDILIPTGMSESFMKLYSLYLFRGISAGEAFLRAKCDYFNTCRSLDGDECAMATVLMFNLYGLPVLHVNRKDSVTSEARGIKRALPISYTSLPSYKPIFDKNGGDGTLLGEVRSFVDRNIQRIRQTVETKLYSYWGLNPADLTKIEQVSQKGISKGYRFEYRSEDGAIKKRSWAYTDTIGNIEDVVHFK